MFGGFRAFGGGVREEPLAAAAPLWRADVNELQCICIVPILSKQKRRWNELCYYYRLMYLALYM